MKGDIAVHRWTGDGYAVLMDFDAWRLGSLRHEAMYEAEQIDFFQRHEVCDEAFVLLSGHCCLLTAGTGERPGSVEGTEMEPLRVYDIRQGVWHSHLVDRDSEVLVIENSNVSVENSPCVPLDEKQRAQVLAIGRNRK